MSYETEQNMIKAAREHFEDEGIEFDEIRAAEVRLVVKGLTIDGKPDYTCRTFYRSIEDHDAGLILAGWLPQPFVDAPAARTHGLT